MFTTNQLCRHPLRPVALAMATALSTLTGCSSTSDDASFIAAGTIDTKLTRVAMRDGTQLYTEILLPAEAADGPVPALLLRTPYDLPTLPLGGLAPDEPEDDDEESSDGDDSDEMDADENPELTRAAWQPVLDRGYAVVFQNLRGTQTSGGRNNLFANERDDGVDTLEWIRAQHWSNGRVGALGDSAAAFSLHLLAAEQPEGLEATFSQVGCGDIWDSAILPEHGGLKLETFLAFMLGQSLEVSDEHLASLGIGQDAITTAEAQVLESLGALFGEDTSEQFSSLTVQPFVDYPGVATLLPGWSDVLDETTRGDRATYFDTRGQSSVPGMHVTLWQDLFVECALEDFQALADGTSEQRLLVFDGSHYEIDDADNWPILPMLDWFDRHLKDVPGQAGAKVQYAVQSASSTDVASMDLADAMSWPPANAIDRSFYLNDGGTLSEGLPMIDLGFTIFANPSDPQTTLGGRNLVIESGVAEQPPIDDNETTAVFTTAPLSNEATIAGEVVLNTTMLTDLADVDLHARLVEVTADGRRLLVVAGLKRARFQSGGLSPMDLVPGQATAIDVTLGNIAHRITKGSRLQLELTTSNFPAWDINPQTGGSAFNATETLAGTVTVLGSPAMPSSLTLPFLP